MNSHSDRLNWVDSLRFWVVLEGFDQTQIQQLREKFHKPYVAVRPHNQQLYASIEFDPEDLTPEFVELLRDVKPFMDVVISIWGKSNVSWGEFYIPSAILALVNELNLGLQVGLGTKGGNANSASPQ